MNTKQTSYTSADSIPVKLLAMCGSEFMKNGVSAIHPQVIPTNRCNLKCTWCSCANEDMALELAYSDIQPLVSSLKNNGAKAVTITGGGEPTMYHHLDYLIDSFLDHDIDVGMVSNGINIGIHKNIGKLEWCRISISDDRDVDRLLIGLTDVMPNQSVDWAFSYVLTANPDYDKLSKVISFANKYSMTHVRVVSDLLDTVNVQPPPDYILDNPLVIYQHRKAPRNGSKLCRMHMIKPVIGPDLKVYTCCGAQYALDPPSLKMPDELCVGKIGDVQSVPFDGSICKRCYYTGYNQALSMLADGGLHHATFI